MDKIRHNFQRTSYKNWYINRNVANNTGGIFSSVDGSIGSISYRSKNYSGLNYKANSMDTGYFRSFCGSNENDFSHFWEKNGNKKKVYFDMNSFCNDLSNSYNSDKEGCIFNNKGSNNHSKVNENFYRFKSSMNSNEVKKFRSNSLDMNKIPINIDELIDSPVSLIDISDNMELKKSVFNKGKNCCQEMNVSSLLNSKVEENSKTENDSKTKETMCSIRSKQNRNRQYKYFNTSEVLRSHNLKESEVNLYRGIENTTFEDQKVENHSVNTVSNKNQFEKSNSYLNETKNRFNKNKLSGLIANNESFLDILPVTHLNHTKVDNMTSAKFGRESSMFISHLTESSISPNALMNSYEPFVETFGKNEFQYLSFNNSSLNVDSNEEDLENDSLPTSKKCKITEKDCLNKSISDITMSSKQLDNHNEWKKYLEEKNNYNKQHNSTLEEVSLKLKVNSAKKKKSVTFLLKNRDSMDSMLNSSLVNKNVNSVKIVHSTPLQKKQCTEFSRLSDALESQVSIEKPNTKEGISFKVDGKLQSMSLGGSTIMEGKIQSDVSAEDGNVSCYSEFESSDNTPFIGFSDFEVVNNIIKVKELQESHSIKENLSTTLNKYIWPLDTDFTKTAKINLNDTSKKLLKEKISQPSICLEDIFDFLPNKKIKRKKIEKHKLDKPAKWTNIKLYNYLFKKLKPKYGFKHRIKSQEFVRYLHSIVESTLLLEESNLYTPLINALKEKMKEMNLTSSSIEFFQFLSNYTPNQFVDKLKRNEIFTNQFSKL